MKTEILKDLQSRGLIHQITNPDGLDALLAEAPVTLYCGFDPTASSLHVGNLLPIITLARFQAAGHRVLALVGGATGRIGDPSGKSAERILQDAQQVDSRAQLIEAQLTGFLDVAGSDAGSGKVVNNLDWTQSLTMLDFLRDVGKHFSVNAMMQRDSVKSRLARDGEGISYTEFTYMLLQSYDFLCLAQSEGCLLQIGGSDQWGNLVSGIDLIRRKLDKEAFGLTVPLLTTSTGAKFGKSEKGAIWLDAEQTSPWDFYQFWVNTADADVGRLLAMFTFLSATERDALAEATRTEPHKRAAQLALAEAMTAMVHGELMLRSIQAAVAVLYGGADAKALDRQTMHVLASAMPVRSVSADDLPKLARVLVDAGLEPSMTQATKTINGGGVSVNGIRQQADAPELLQTEEPLSGGFFLVKKGKRSFVLLEVSK